MTDSAPKLAYDLDRDLRVLSAMASSLTPYLYEDELYGPLGGDLPKLTLGGLLMRLFRLSRLDDALDAREQDMVRDARLNVEAEKSQWATHYEQKLGRELQSRLDALDFFIRECVEDPHSCLSGYPSQAEKRIMIEHLAEEAADLEVLDEETANRIHQTDQRLRRILGEGAFVLGDVRLQAIYSPERFWWLYRQVTVR